MATEVQEVVRRILAHAEKRPRESLGVIALGITHANRIDEALRDVVRWKPELDGFFAESADEPFFIKNLERVQGDERDAIILSVGYGKTTDGRLLHRFGPINIEGGERRLNVAITRAKRRITVVSSFGSAEMDPARTTSRGARLLRDYLRYAESHGTAKNPRAIAGVQVGPRASPSSRRFSFAIHGPCDIASRSDGPDVSSQKLEGEEDGRGDARRAKHRPFLPATRPAGLQDLAGT